jgi:hypothetical protein
MGSVRVLLIACVVLGASHRASALALDCDRCTVPILGTRFSIAGSINTEPLAVDIAGYAPRARIGAVELREVVLTARDRGNTIRACMAGDLEGTHVLGCATLPRSLERLQRMRATDVTWRLSGAATGSGTAHVAWTEHAAHIDVELAGAARVAVYDAGPLHLRDITLPLALGIVATGDAVEVVPRGAIVARAGDASIELGSRTLHVVDATLVAHDDRPFRVDAFSGDAHELSWRAIRGLPVEVGAGSATLRFVAGELRVERMHAGVLDATVDVDTFVVRDDIETALHVRGLALAPLVRSASHGRVLGTGIVDGDLVVRRDGDDLSITRGELHARGTGELHLVDPVWRAKAAGTVASLAIQRRIVTALADFAYDKLSFAVQPRGSDPESIIRLHGRGTSIPQELDFAIDVHGARRSARWLVAHL